MLRARETIREFSEDPDRMVILVDPRLSETARMSDMHVALRPGTDALLVRAMIALILKEGWQDQAYIDKYVADFDQVKHWYENVDIEGSCRVAGVPYEQVRELCRILTTRKWGMHQDLGIFMGRHNTLSSFLLLALCVICGQLLMPGGSVIYPGYVDLGVAPNNENDPAVWRTVATNRFPVLGVYPTGVLPEEIMNDNPERVRSVFVSMSNSARSFPDSNAQEEAYSKLDLLVVMEMCMTETARHAHYVLPCKSSYEMDDFSIFQWNYPETFCHIRTPIVDPEGERKEGAEIWLGLLDAMGVMPPIPDSLYEAAQNKTRMEYMGELMAFMQANPAYMPAIIPIIGKTMGKAMGSVNKSMMWLVLMNSNPAFQKNVPHAGFNPGPTMMDDVFQAVIDHPEGVFIASPDINDPEENFRFLVHPDHKFHIYHDVLNEYIKDITPEKEAAELNGDKEFPLILSAGRHADGGANAIMRNPETYRFRNPCTLALNPEDAEELGIKDGQWVRVTTEAGSAEIETEITYQTRKGYILIPHHFGFNFNGKTYGIHVNSLTPARHMESVTGNPIWRYVPCRVEAI
jgi:anaerobic selenocysteine-containing dehydrogenase